MLPVNDELLPEIRNKMTAPLTALEKLVEGKEVPHKFLVLALKELRKGLTLLEELNPSEWMRKK